MEFGMIKPRGTTNKGLKYKNNPPLCDLCVLCGEECFKIYVFVTRSVTNVVCFMLIHRQIKI